MRQEFGTHRLNSKGFEKASKIAEAFEKCLDQLETHVPAGRELAIVKTKLEEAAFFAKKGMAVIRENQEPL